MLDVHVCVFSEFANMARAFGSNLQTQSTIYGDVYIRARHIDPK